MRIRVTSTYVSRPTQPKSVIALNDICASLFVLVLTNQVGPAYVR